VLVRGILRDAYKEDLDEEGAREGLVKAMKVLFYRDARTINKVSIFL